MMQKPLSKRKCKNCSEIFQKTQPLQYVCSPTCAAKYASKKLAAEKDKEIKLKVDGMKLAIMKKADWMKLLQVTFNTFIRIRDKDEPCISCGTFKSNKWDAGHCYPTTYAYLRFNEHNVNKQCSFYCNLNKSGNFHEYLPRLEAKIGIDAVQKLHNDRHKILDLSVNDIQELIKLYKLKIKQLKNQKL
jgi:hypothetical protein